MPCQAEGLTHTCPPITPVLRTLTQGQIPPPSLLPCVTRANDVHCLDLSLHFSSLSGRMPAGPSWQEALGRRCHL